MKKVVLWILALAVLAILPLVANAETSGTCGASVNWTLNDSGVLTISGEGTMYDDKTKWSSQFATEDVLSIQIESGVTSIGVLAFDGCTKATGSVIIPGTVLSIAKGAFSYCKGLQSIEIPDSVTSIAEYAFINHGAGGYIYGTVPATRFAATVDGKAAHSLSAAGYTFRNKDYPGIDLQYFYEGTTVTNFAIVGSDTTITEVKWPAGITKLGTGAFKNCSTLAAITIPATVTVMESEAFSGCSGLQSIEIPNSISTLSTLVFDHCSKLQEVTIPTSVQSIEAGVFSYCSLLKKITLPDSVVSVHKNAFINHGAGGYIYGTVKTLRFVPTLEGNAAMALTNAGYSFRHQDYPDLDLQYVLNANGKIEEAHVVSADTVIMAAVIPDDFTHIDESAFSGCAEMISVKMPDSISSVGKNAFKNCKKLEKVYYKGSEEQWAAITIADGNDLLKNATIYCNGEETDPTPTPAPTDEPTPTPAPTDEPTQDPDEPTPTPAPVPVKKIKLNKTSATLTITLSKKGTVQLKATVSPSNATNRAVVWKSSNTKVAKVSKTGKVTAVGKGSCKITATAADGSKVSAICKVTVTITEAKTAFLKYSLDNKKGTATVIGPAKNNLSKLAIPDTVSFGKKTYQVTAVGDNALKGYSKLKKLTLGKNLKTIGKSAFEKCSHLEIIVVQTDKISKIGKSAFKGVKPTVKLYISEAFKMIYIRKLVSMFLSGGIGEIIQIFQ